MEGPGDSPAIGESRKIAPKRNIEGLDSSSVDEAVIEEVIDQRNVRRVANRNPWIKDALEKLTRR